MGEHSTHLAQDSVQSMVGNLKEVKTNYSFNLSFRKQKKGSCRTSINSIERGKESGKKQGSKRSHSS
jgi:hypothetical protein